MRYLQVIVACVLMLEMSWMVGCRATLKEKQEGKDHVKYEQKLNHLRQKIQLTPLFEKWHHAFQGEDILNVYISQELVFAETKSKKVFALERKNGITAWMYQMQHPLDFAPEATENQVYLVSMSTIHILDKKSGEVLKKVALPFSPSSPLAVGDKYMYVVDWNNFIHALDKTTGMQGWRYRIDGNAYAAPSISEGTLLVPGTESVVYAIESHSGETASDWGENGRYVNRGANIARMTIQNNPPVVYLPSTDYNLYSLNKVDGRLIWKFESGGEISKPVHIVGNYVYVISNRKGKADGILYVLDSESGREKWHVENGVQLLFLGKSYDWVRLHDNRLASIRNETGELKSTFDMKDFDFFLTNTADNSGYVATKDGFVFALEEK